MEEYNDIQFLMAIELKCSCFTCQHLNSEFVMSAQSVFWSWMAPLDFSAFYIFMNFLKFDEKKKSFSYAVRPFCRVTCNWSLVDKWFHKKKVLLGCLNKFAWELQNKYEPYNLCEFYVTRKMYLVRIKGTFLKNFIHHFLCSSKTK